MIAEILRELDTNNNGRVEKSELDSFIKKTAGNMVAQFKAMFTESYKNLNAYKK